MPTSAVRPRRSVLYMPGSNPRALEKARSLPADALILDLEDAVAPEAKEEARQRVCQAVAEGGFGPREVIVRINALETEWGADDLVAAVKVGPDAILVPKVMSGQMLRTADKLMGEFGASLDMGLWAMMETPLAILHAEEIAAARNDTRLSAFVMGTNDLAKELHCLQTPDRLPFATSLSLALLAGRAYGLAVIDGVYNDIQNADGFEAECRQGVAFGFDGKTLIHPSQIEPCNRIFAPEASAVDWARRIIAEFEKPGNADKAVVKVEGRMVERLHAQDAERLVALADAIAEREG
jgi:citrate lyase subunit beta/citryl-CoA lyase